MSNNFFENQIKAMDSVPIMSHINDLHILICIYCMYVIIYKLIYIGVY